MLIDPLATRSALAAKAAVADDISNYGHRYQIGKPTGNAVKAIGTVRRLNCGCSQDRRLVEGLTIGLYAKLIPEI